jgi:hypothetical protein
MTFTHLLCISDKDVLEQERFFENEEQLRHEISSCLLDGISELDLTVYSLTTLEWEWDMDIKIFGESLT